jgi:hypothetical protein
MEEEGREERAEEQPNESEDPEGMKIERFDK